MKTNWNKWAGISEASFVKPTLTVGERQDRVLLGPDGGEISRIVDRPFRGYRREQ